MRNKFLTFLTAWLAQRAAVSYREHHVFHEAEVPQLPEGYYAVVTVELKRIPSDHPLVVETVTMKPEYA